MRLIVAREGRRQREKTLLYFQTSSGSSPGVLRLARPGFCLDLADNFSAIRFTGLGEIFVGPNAVGE